MINENTTVSSLPHALHKHLVHHQNEDRFHHYIPIGTGFPPYGWKWKDKDKTEYTIDKEEAAVRFSIFEMFVEMDMSIRSIVHKLTADGIPTATQSRNPKSKKGLCWTTATVFRYLKDKINIGILEICKLKNVRGEDGKIKHVANPDKKEIRGGIPAIIPQDLYERAQRKLATNREEKSRLPRNPEEYLLRGHIYCATCGYKMSARYNTGHYVYYCVKFSNNYNKCPDRPTIVTDEADNFVWNECCQLFERSDFLRATLDKHIEDAMNSLLEDTKGKEQIAALTAAIEFAKQECNKHAKDSYYYILTSQDIQAKTEQLQRYEEECAAASSAVAMTAAYKERVMKFSDFLNKTKGNYHNASFQEKRDALDMLGVKVSIRQLEKGKNDRKSTIKKDIHVTYSPLFTGVNSSEEIMY